MKLNQDFRKLGGLSVRVDTLRVVSRTSRYVLKAGLFDVTYCESHDNYNSGVFNNITGALLSGNDSCYLQNIIISTDTSNMKRYFSAKNIAAGYDVTNKKTYGPVIFTNGSTIIMDATNSVLLKKDVKIEAGCTFEIK